jgi:hypothetical protein
MLKSFRKAAALGLLAGSAVVLLHGQQIYSYAAGMWSTLPMVGQSSFCASNVSGVVTPGSQGPYAIVPGSTQGSGQGICAQTVPAGPALTGLESIPADEYPANAVTTAQGGSSPQTVTIASSVLAGATGGNPRNFLGNGALNSTQVNGTSTVTGATTSAPTIAAIGADRWIIDTNVGSGAGQSAIVTATPAPPVGFTQVMKVWRNSAALTQPVCTWSAVPTPDSLQLAGNTVTFSASVAALAGLAADNGGVANLVIISGTGTDQALNGAWTASPAITPAWTGITTVINTPIVLSTTFARFATTAVIPATATEVGVGICFTPTAAGSGATDGFAWVGAQLEKAPGASLFEVRQKAQDVAAAQQYIFSISEGAATTVRAMCMASSTTLAICGMQFPVPMYKVPTMAYTNGFATATTVAGSTLGPCTTLRTSTLVAGNAPTVDGVMLDCVAATVPAAGSADYLADNGVSGKITAWTGF